MFLKQETDCSTDTPSSVLRNA